MKKLLLVIVLISVTTIALAQKSYIQITGEPNLSVYLDGSFKGTTTAEYNGYIIENVSPGNHTIKITKTGYTPFEEVVSIKQAEVFAYKVKPFVKALVTISQQGGGAETTKTSVIKTGKLVIQSVPIEIKISIPSIEGLNNMAKTKDEWIANDMPVGTYDVEMSFGGKKISKRVEVTADDVTHAFVNMMSGEFTVNKAVTEEKQKAINERYVTSLFRKYGLVFEQQTAAQVFANNPEARVVNNYSQTDKSVYRVPVKDILKDPSLTPGTRRIGVMNSRNQIVAGYDYALKRFNNYDAAFAAVKEAAREFDRQTGGVIYQQELTNSIMFYYRTPSDETVRIEYEVEKIGENVYELQLVLMPI